MNKSINITLQRVVAGCMNWGQWGEKFSAAQYERLIKDCLTAGITWFDHADIYGGYTTEEEFGQALRREPSLRDELRLISKCGIRMISPNRPAYAVKSYDTSARHILASAEKSLQNLHTDHLDILLIHRPDPLLHPDEVAEAFHQLKQQGKVLHFGVSNFMPSQTALLHARFPVEFHQLEISVLKMDALHNGQLDQCLEWGIVPMAWGPLGGGLLMKKGAGEKAKRIMEVAESVAAKLNCTVVQVLLSFLFQHPAGIIPVLGSTRIERLAEGLAAASILMEKEDWFRLWEASAGHEVP